MGNDLSRGANRMAVAAMANVTHLEKRELLGLQKKFHELSRRQGSASMLSKEDFQEALQFIGVHESDAEILSRLFIMFDKTGDNRINHREFVVALAPLASGEAQDKVALAFRLFDASSAGGTAAAGAAGAAAFAASSSGSSVSATSSSGGELLRASEVVFCLTAMNSLASFFGDPVLSPDQIDRLVSDVAAEADAAAASAATSASSSSIASGSAVPLGFLRAGEVVPLIVAHPLFQQFLQGGGTVRYGAARS